MPYYDRIDILEGIDINKTNESKERNICNYWYFLDTGFKYQPYICNRCYDVLMVSMSLRDIAILNINGADHCCIVIGISKDKAVNLLRKTDSKD